jgi:hypothetical protein
MQPSIAASPVYFTPDERNRPCQGRAVSDDRAAADTYPTFPRFQVSLGDDRRFGRLAQRQIAPCGGGSLTDAGAMCSPTHAPAGTAAIA